MALPVQSIRARPEHRDILQTVADLLREGREPVVRKLLRDAKARPVGPFKDEAAALAFLRDRLVRAPKAPPAWRLRRRARGHAPAHRGPGLPGVWPHRLP